MRMEATLVTTGNEREAMVWAKGEVADLIILGGTHYGHCLWHHQLVGAVSVQVNTGQEGSLGRVCLEQETK